MIRYVGPWFLLLYPLPGLFPHIVIGISYYEFLLFHWITYLTSHKSVKLPTVLFFQSIIIIFCIVY